MRLKGRLFWKYAAVIVVVMNGALLLNSLVQTSESAQETRGSIIRLQRELAASAAAAVRQYLGEIDQQLAFTFAASELTEAQATSQRQSSYDRLLRQTRTVHTLQFIRPDGSESIRVGRALTCAPRPPGRTEEAVREALGSGQWLSPAYGAPGSETCTLRALRESDAGVVVAEIGLGSLRDLTARLPMGSTGQIYVLDSQDQLVSHPDVRLLSQQPSIATLPQALAVQERPRIRAGDYLVQMTISKDQQARDVLVASTRIEPSGWTVLVDRPLEEAFGVLYSGLWRTGLILAIGLILSIVVSLALARRMTVPIGKLQAGAARVAEGDLEQRIEVRTGDEMEELANQFNVMTERLHDSYATLEQQVEDRTRELQVTLEHFAGDGFMVFFNDPIPCPDPALRAVRMALRLRERVAELAASWRKRGYELGCGIGIAHGFANLGTIGFPGAMHYAAIGSVSNLGARLCAEAVDGQIIVSHGVFLEVEHLVEAQPIAPLTLKGFSRPVPAYEVLAPVHTGLTPLPRQPS
jgi:class 3 adenylate cyclase